MLNSRVNRAPVTRVARLGIVAALSAVAATVLVGALLAV